MNLVSKVVRAGIVLGFGLYLFSGCTSNPFGDDDITGGNRTISGKVTLSEGFSPEGVYVWLEGLDIGTTTNADGNFEIVLPPSSVQGVTGVFNVYFYVANFNPAIKPVAVRNGEFLYSNGELNSKGEFQSTIFLTQSLRIDIDVEPDTLNLESSGSLASARITLAAVSAEVSVFWPLTVGDHLAPLLFRNKDTGELFVLDSVVGGFENNDTLTILQSPRTRLLVASVEPAELSAGHYEVMPYLFVENDDVPEKLLESIVDEIGEIDEDYLNVPFKRTGGELLVIK